MNENNENNEKIKKPKIKKNKIYLLKNPDKSIHQHWNDKDHPTSNLINIPRPYRMLITAQPNCGKTNLIKNILIQMKPIPKNIWIAHAETWQGCKSKNQNEEDFLNMEVKEISEYKGIKAIYLKSLPKIEYWDKFKDQHNLLIIDDVNLKEWANKSRVRMNILDKTLSWCSTHRNLTIICAVQSIYQQGMPALYRFSNVFILYKMYDRYVNAQIAKNTGVSNENYKRLMNLCKTPYDNIMIDHTLNSPAEIRFNLTEVIRDEDSDSEDSDSSDSEDEKKIIE